MTSRRQTNVKRSSKQITADLRLVGRRIREIRGFNLSQREFGQILGITQAQLSKYELGLSAPTPDILLKLKSYSGKSIDWILGGEEPKSER
jgi:transcriptional regulator with XRE-family HTH domain